MNVKRYDFGTQYTGSTGMPAIVEKADGKYVSHEDFAALLSHNDLQAAQLQKQAREMAAGNRFTPHWYAVDNAGMATLCVDERDARESAKEFAETWPNRSPYFVGRVVALTQQEQV